MPEDAWLKGYFYVCPEADAIGGSRVQLGVWKNVDYLRLKDFALHLVDPRPGKVILDVGCANGAVMVYCGLQGAEVYGQDLSENDVDAANNLLKRFGIAGEAKCGDAVKLAFSSDRFDSVISGDFFEHIPDDVKLEVLKEILRVLKPGGTLVIKTPNLSYLRVALLYKRCLAIMRLSNPFRLTIPHTPGTDDPQHIGLTTRWKLSRLLSRSGFLNYQFFYAPLRRFGLSSFMEVLSLEIPVIRDLLCEDLFCKACKPISLSHFPD